MNVPRCQSCLAFNRTQSGSGFCQLYPTVVSKSEGDWCLQHVPRAIEPRSPEEEKLLKEFRKKLLNAVEDPRFPDTSIID